LSQISGRRREPVEIRRGDRLRDDLRPGPQHVDRRVKVRAEVAEVPGSGHVARHPSAVGGRAEEQPRRGVAPALAGQQPVGEGDLRRRVVLGGPEMARGGCRHDVIEQHREVPGPEAGELVHLGVERGVSFRGRECGIESRGQRGDERDARLSAGGDEFPQALRFVRRIRVAPARAVAEVVLGRVQVGVEAKVAELPHQGVALGVRPRPAVEAFDHPS
jgi:hypothetical protein